MDADRFRAIVEAYGADPKRWPAAERAAVQRFRLANPEIARAAIEAAAALDAALDAAPGVEGVDAVASRILARAPRRGSAQALGPILALAASALIGIGVGFVGVQGAADRAAAEASLAQAFPDFEQSWTELGG